MEDTVVESIAKELDGIEYPVRIPENCSRDAKKFGIVIVYGASDDLMEFRGAIDDEVGAYDGGEALVDARGLLPSRSDIDDDVILEDFFARRKLAWLIEALWCAEGEWRWTFRTDIPHATFEVGETDGNETNPYCRGIVFSLDDLKRP